VSREPERVGATRVQRGVNRRRRGFMVALGAVVLVAVVAFAVVRWGGGDDAPSQDQASDGVTVDAEGPTTLAFQVRGTTAPMMAIIGAGTEEHAATIMPMPADLTIVGPGQGEITIPEVAGLPGESMRIDLSNMAGTWLDAYAVISLNGFAELVDRAGGIQVNLGEAYPTKSGSLGPGAVTLTGQQAKAFLAGSTDDAATRWEFVLTALLEDPPQLEETDLAETDDAEAAAQVFAGAQSADVTQVPTVVVAGTVRVPKYDDLDRIMTTSFGAATPTPAIVQNGNGEAGVGEAVGAKLIPAGFRITLSQNAQTFDVVTTDVFANGVEYEEDAKRARKALGIGRVRVSEVQSGIGDVLIVVGKDFTVDQDGSG
jgi:polyisoprenyl-teichoic acid--peptidoglycan teichoic acid transferase